MHELSIAQSIVETAQASAVASNALSVTAVHLNLGELSGALEDALQFCYGLATANTILDGSRLVIERKPVIVFCHQCQALRTLPGIQSFRCPVCQEPSSDIRQGCELEISSIIIEVEGELDGHAGVGASTGRTE